MDNIENLVKNVMGQLANQKETIDWQKIWEDLKVFSQFTMIDKYDQGLLYVNVDQAARIVALNAHKNTLIEQLKAFGVNDIIFKVGKVKR